MGIVCPLGLGRRARLAAADQRRIAASAAIQSFDTKDLPGKIAGQVPQGSKAEGKLDLAEWIPVKDQKKMDRFIQLGIVAAVEAVEDSGWMPEDEEDRCATGVMIGSGIGGLQTIHEASQHVLRGEASGSRPSSSPPR